MTIRWPDEVMGVNDLGLPAPVEHFKCSLKHAPTFSDTRVEIELAP
jgi:hypothetical protein